MERVKHVVFAIFFGFVVAVIIYAASQTIAYRPFLKLQNAIDDSHFFRRFILKGIDGQETENIIIVDIDDRSLETLGSFKYWPRRHFTRVIGNLKRDSARLIFMDALLLEGGNERNNRALADSIKSAGNVLAGYYFHLDPKSKSKRPKDPVFNERFSSNWLKPRTLGKNEFLNAEHIILPYKELVKSVRDIGFTNYLPDPDGILRHIPLFISFNSGLYPSASLQLWLYLNGHHYSDATISPSGILIDETFIPTDKHCFMRLNFTASKPVYTYVSFVDVLNESFEPGMFREKVVMIGSSSEKLGDLKRIPGYSSLPGVEIHATALTTLMNEKFLTVLSGNFVFIITVLLSVIVSMVFTFAHPVKVGLPVVLCLPLGLYIYAIYSFIAHSRLINITLPSFVIILLYVVIVIHRMVEQYENGE